MTSEDLWYTPPKQDLFDELKKISIEIWEAYDDTHGYSSEKIGQIKGLRNIRDNFMFMFQMFDWVNQTKVLSAASDELKTAIRERLI